MIVLPLAVEWWLQRRQQHSGDQPTLRSLVLVGGAVVIPFAAVLLWFWSLTGAPFIFIGLHEGYGQVTFTFPWEVVRAGFARPELMIRDLPLVGAGFLLLLWAWRHMPWVYRIFWVLMQIIILTYSLQSYLRHSMLLYPALLALGLMTARWPRFGKTALLASTLFCALYGVLFINAYWVG